MIGIRSVTEIIYFHPPKKSAGVFFPHYSFQPLIASAYGDTRMFIKISFFLDNVTNL